MNYDEVINRLIKHISPLRDIESTYNNEAIDLAIVAIRAQQERDNPKPLTFEELKERVGKVIWIKTHAPKDMPWVDMKTEIYPYIIRGFSDSQMNGATEEAHEWRQLSEYENWWVAYDHEPKGAAK